MMRGGGVVRVVAVVVELPRRSRVCTVGVPGPDDATGVEFDRRERSGRSGRRSRRE